MFTFNHACAYCVVDWDSLENPLELCLSLLTNSSIILLLIGNCEPSFLILKRQFPKRIQLRDTNTDDEISLRRYIDSHPRQFDDIFVSGSIERIAIANEYAFGTALICEAPTECDARVGADWLGSSTEFKKFAARAFYGGLLGEFIAFPNRRLLAGYAPDARAMVFAYRFSTDFNQCPTAYALGRFLRSRDRLKDRHPFTQLIKKAKTSPHLFRYMVKAAITHFVKHLQNEGADSLVVTYVPQKPADPIDRNKELLNGLETEALLFCEEDFPKQRDQGSYEARKQNVSGKFLCKEELTGKNILLFDDVYTSGSTLRECAETLLANGAESVVPLALGIACDVSPSFLPALSCEHCGAELKVRFNNSNGNCFWGCPNYNDGKKHSTKGFDIGLNELRSLQLKAEAEIHF